MALGQLKSFVNDKIDAGKESIQNWGSSTLPSYNPSGAQAMFYPIDLRGEKRPTIEFSVFDTSSGSVDIKTIFFPAPGGIQIQDGAQYNNLDLGALGGALDIPDLAPSTSPTPDAPATGPNLPLGF